MKITLESLKNILQNYNLGKQSYREKEDTYVAKKCVWSNLF